MNLEFETNFTVMPPHTNYMYPLIFGGAFFSQIDLCAAQCVTRLLHDSDFARAAVTYKYEGTFHKPCYCGDLIFLKGTIIELRSKSIVVEVKAHREKRGEPGQDFVAEAKLVFVTVDDPVNVVDKPDLLPYIQHGLKMPS